MKILSLSNPAHDGAFAYLEDGYLVASIEAEKNSRYRYSPLTVPDVFSVLGELNEVPDVLCRGGWWPSDAPMSEQNVLAGYHGVSQRDIIVGQKRLLGKRVKYFSSSHERSHLLCAFGMSNLPKGTPCYGVTLGRRIGSILRNRLRVELDKARRCHA